VTVDHKQGLSGKGHTPIVWPLSHRMREQADTGAGHWGLGKVKDRGGDIQMPENARNPDHTGQAKGTGPARVSVLNVKAGCGKKLPRNIHHITFLRRTSPAVMGAPGVSGENDSVLIRIRGWLLALANFLGFMPCWLRSFIR